MKERTAPVFMLILSIVLTTGAMALGSTKALPPRKVISLDGNWNIEQGKLESVPPTFSHTVVVPGLADMAKPAFADVGKKSKLRDAFWYRRTFRLDGPVPAVAILKIHKAKYGIKVFLNGHVVGEHLPCFTPALLDLQPYLKGDGQPNELVIRVGAQRDLLPKDMVTGSDFEKCRYIPGIYDSVELILTAAPYIVNLQAVPDVSKQSVRVVAEIQAGQKDCDFTADMEVCEARSGRAVGAAKAPSTALGCRPTGKARSDHPHRRLPSLVARGSVSLRTESHHRQRRRQDPFRHEIVPLRSEDATGDAQRKALLHAWHERVHLPFLRGCPSWRSALECRLGSTLAPNIQVDALGLDPLLHRFPAGTLV